MNTLYLLATIASQPVAIPSDDVLSVVDLGDVVPVPRTPAYVRGLAALRSRVVTAIDAGLAIGATAIPCAARRAVVTRVDGHDYALLVDALDDVTELELRRSGGGIAFAPAWATVAQGVVEQDGRPMLVLDLAAVATAGGLPSEAAA